MCAKAPGGGGGGGVCVCVCVCVWRQTEIFPSWRPYTDIRFYNLYSPEVNPNYFRQLSEKIFLI